MSEDDLLRCVLDLAKLLGLRTAHFRAAKVGNRYMTAVQDWGVWKPKDRLPNGGRIQAELEALR